MTLMQVYCSVGVFVKDYFQNVSSSSTCLYAKQHSTDTIFCQFINTQLVEYVRKLNNAELSLKKYLMKCTRNNLKLVRI